jgi:hypothetical protein
MQSSAKAPGAHICIYMRRGKGGGAEAPQKYACESTCLKAEV